MRAIEGDTRIHGDDDDEDDSPYGKFNQFHQYLRQLISDPTSSKMPPCIVTKNSYNDQILPLIEIGLMDVNELPTFQSCQLAHDPLIQHLKEKEEEDVVKYSLSLDQKEEEDDGEDVDHDEKLKWNHLSFPYCVQLVFTFLENCFKITPFNASLIQYILFEKDSITNERIIPSKLCSYLVSYPISELHHSIHLHSQTIFNPSLIGQMTIKDWEGNLSNGIKEEEEEKCTQLTEVDELLDESNVFSLYFDHVLNVNPEKYPHNYELFFENIGISINQSKGNPSSQNPQTNSSNSSSSQSSKRGRGRKKKKKKKSNSSPKKSESDLAFLDFQGYQLKIYFLLRGIKNCFEVHPNGCDRMVHQFLEAKTSITSPLMLSERSQTILRHSFQKLEALIIQLCDQMKDFSSSYPWKLPDTDIPDEFDTSDLEPFYLVHRMTAFAENKNKTGFIQNEVLSKLNENRCSMWRCGYLVSLLLYVRYQTNLLSLFPMPYQCADNEESEEEGIVLHKPPLFKTIFSTIFPSCDTSPISYYHGIPVIEPLRRKTFGHYFDLDTQLVQILTFLVEIAVDMRDLPLLFKEIKLYFNELQEVSTQQKASRKGSEEENSEIKDQEESDLKGFGLVGEDIGNPLVSYDLFGGQRLRDHFKLDQLSSGQYQDLVSVFLVDPIDTFNVYWNDLRNEVFAGLDSIKNDASIVSLFPSLLDSFHHQLEQQFDYLSSRLEFINTIIDKENDENVDEDERIGQDEEDNKEDKKEDIEKEGDDEAGKDNMIIVVNSGIIGGTPFHSPTFINWRDVVFLNNLVEILTTFHPKIPSSSHLSPSFKWLQFEEGYNTGLIQFLVAVGNGCRVFEGSSSIYLASLLCRFHSLLLWLDESTPTSCEGPLLLTSEYLGAFLGTYASSNLPNLWNELIQIGDLNSLQVLFSERILKQSQSVLRILETNPLLDMNYVAHVTIGSMIRYSLRYDGGRGCLPHMLYCRICKDHEVLFNNTYFAQEYIKQTTNHVEEQLFGKIRKIRMSPSNNTKMNEFNMLYEDPEKLEKVRDLVYTRQFRKIIVNVLKIPEFYQLDRRVVGKFLIMSLEMYDIWEKVQSRFEGRSIDIHAMDGPEAEEVFVLGSMGKELVAVIIKIARMYFFNKNPVYPEDEDVLNDRFPNFPLKFADFLCFCSLGFPLEPNGYTLPKSDLMIHQNKVLIDDILKLVFTMNPKVEEQHKFVIYMLLSFTYRKDLFEVCYEYGFLMYMMREMFLLYFQWFMRASRCSNFDQFSDYHKYIIAIIYEHIGSAILSNEDNSILGIDDSLMNRMDGSYALGNPEIGLMLMQLCLSAKSLYPILQKFKKAEEEENDVEMSEFKDDCIEYGYVAGFPSRSDSKFDFLFQSSSETRHEYSLSTLETEEEKEKRMISHKEHNEEMEERYAKPDLDIESVGMSLFSIKRFIHFLFLFASDLIEQNNEPDFVIPLLAGLTDIYGSEFSPLIASEESYWVEFFQSSFQENTIIQFIFYPLNCSLQTCEALYVLFSNLCLNFSEMEKVHTKINEIFALISNNLLSPNLRGMYNTYGMKNQFPKMLLSILKIVHLSSDENFTTGRKEKMIKKVWKRLGIHDYDKITFEEDDDEDEEEVGKSLELLPDGSGMTQNELNQQVMLTKEGVVRQLFSSFKEVGKNMSFDNNANFATKIDCWMVSVVCDAILELCYSNRNNTFKTKISVFIKACQLQTFFFYLFFFLFIFTLIIVLIFVGGL